MSQETAMAINKTVKMYIFPCVFLFGFTTNILNGIIFYRQGVKDRMNLCLFWLSLTDLCYLTFFTPVVASSFVGLVDPGYAREYLVNVQYYTTGLLTAFMQTSGSLTAVIAMERCVCVVFPLKAQTLLSARTMAFILTAITSLLHLFFSTFMLRREPRLLFDKRKGTASWVLGVGERGNQNAVFVLYYIFFDLLQFMLPIVNMGIVIVCTIVTAWRLRMASAWRLTTSSSNSSSVLQHQQVSLTKMLIVISCIFIACSLPSCVLSLLRRAEPQFSVSGYYANIFTTAHVVNVHVIVAINSSVNFCVYYRRSSKFRAELNKVFCLKTMANSNSRTNATRVSKKGNN